MEDTKKNHTDKFEIGKYYEVLNTINFEGEEPRHYKNVIKVIKLRQGYAFDLIYNGVELNNKNISSSQVSSSRYHTIYEVTKQYYETSINLVLEKLRNELLNNTLK